ncbi:MAG: siderophore-interacting protein [Microbacterium arborescens]
MRTYTTRAVRRGAREVDIDMVAHDVLGPASAWIAEARVGDEVCSSSDRPRRTAVVSYGIDFVPPAATDAILLAGDETAAPAIAVILEQLPPEARGTVVLEVPTAADLGYLPSHPGFEIRAAARAGESERHAHLIAAVEETAARLAPGGVGADVEEIDVDTDILWEVPRTAKGGAALKRAPLYAWLAGEAGRDQGLATPPRRHGRVDRRAVAFMGYWRLGRSEN